MPADRQSKYRGVYWNKARSQWESKLCAAGKKLSLGMFTDEVDAAKRYDSVLRRLLTRFNQGLNFPRAADKIVTEDEQHRARVLEQDKGKATPGELGIVPRDQARRAVRPRPQKLSDPCTHPDRDGRHEEYRNGEEIVCRACGARGPSGIPVDLVRRSPEDREKYLRERGLTDVGTTTEDAVLSEAEDDQEFPDLSVEALMGKSA